VKYKAERKEGGGLNRQIRKKREYCGDIQESPPGLWACERSKLTKGWGRNKKHGRKGNLEGGNVFNGEGPTGEKSWKTDSGGRRF